MGQEPIEPSFAFAELGRIKLGEMDLASIVDRVAGLARTAVPGATEVSITLIRDRGAYTAAFTGEPALRLDQLQYAGQAGPCLDAATEKSTVAVPDTATDGRWNGWPARAAEAGVGSVLSLGMPILDTVGGALNVYGRDRGAFDHGTVRLARTYADYATVVLANAHLYDSKVNLAEHMQVAMDSRAVIEQAKGIIMGERRCTADEAFVILSKVSQESNRKLREVAAALVARAQAGPPE